MIKLLFVLNLEANNVAFNITKSGYFLVIAYSQTHNLVLVVVEVLLIVKYITNIPHSFYSAVPRGAHDFLTLFQVYNVVD